MFRTKSAKPSKSDVLSARPVRNPDATEKSTGASAWQLSVPMRSRAWANWLMRVPEGVKKSFELDELGKFVWDACDGKTSVRQIIRKLAKQYNLNEREAEVSTVAFLQMLTKRGLIGIAMKDEI